MAKEFYFTTSDVKRIFLRKKSFYGRVFLSSCLLVMCFYLLKAPLYTSTALFKQSSQTGKETEMFQTILQNSSFALKESSAQSILESRTLLKQVVEELALQIEVQESFWIKWPRRIKNRLRAELGMNVVDERKLHFSHVSFSNDTPVDFLIRFVEEGCFEVLDGLKHKAIRGTVGFPVAMQKGTFILKEAVGIKGTYQIRVHPWIEGVKKARSHLTVKPSKADKNVLSLAFSYPYAKEASSFLNALMGAYQGYLKSENEEIASTQMLYLQKRQEELTRQYEKSLEEHVSFLGSNLKDTGFMSFKQELDLLEQPNEEYLGRLYDVDLQLQRLALRAEKKEKYKNKLCQQTEKKGETILSTSLGNVFEKKLKRKQEIEEKQQKSIEKDSYHEAQEISPELVQDLLLECEEQLDVLHTAIEQLSYIQIEIEKPHFDITSLGEFLTDRICQETIQKACQITLAIEDLDNHSEKDINRLKETLGVQKRFLSQHIIQLLQMHRLKKNLLEEKISSLQQTSAKLLHVEKELIQHQLNTIQDQMKTLPEKWKRESQLMMQKDLSIGVIGGLSQLAESKNIRHQLFQVESKPIDFAFSPYKTTPSYALAQCVLFGLLASMCFFLIHFIRWLSLGRAITEDSAKEIAVAFCGYLKKNFCDLLHEVGPDDKETLRKVSSYIATAKPADVGLCVTLLSPSPFLARNTVSLLALKGLRVLWIECTPSSIGSHKRKGLYDFLSERSSIEKIQEEGFDLVVPGAYKSFFVELLFRKEFTSFTQENKAAYDVVLLSLDAEAQDAAVVPLKELSDLFIIHAQDVFYEEISQLPHVAVVIDP